MIGELRKKLERLQGKRQLLETNIDSNAVALVDAEKYSIRLDKTRAILQEVAQITQEELEYKVSELVSMGLAAVFDNPYQLVLEFEQKRNKTEAEIYFEREGSLVHPLGASGGGASDIASFLLRCALWNLPVNRSRSTMLLDEPCKNLNDDSRVLHVRAARMMKMICEKLGLQIIIVTLMPELLECADTTFHVKMKNERSYLA